MNKTEFFEKLHLKGLTEQTVNCYRIDVKTYEDFLQDNNFKMDLESIVEYKAFVYEKFKPATAERKLIIANKFFHAITGIKSEVKPTKVQREYKEFLTPAEFKRIMAQVDKAEDTRTRAMIEALAYTGLRYSELRFLTVESLKERMITINNKGTIRKVPLVDFLIKDLKKYLKTTDIKSGLIFQTISGKLVDAAYFYKLLKKYTGAARGIKKEKVSAHAFRHLFAKNYLEMDKTSVLDLADILGHKDLATTRIYTQKSIKEHRNTLDNMKKM